MPGKQSGVRSLFLDDEHITRIVNLRRVVNQPVEHEANPVLKPEKPWEMGGVSNYGTMLYDERESLFKFWYLTIPGCGEKEMITMDGKQWPSNRTLLCYATSRDGVDWIRPELGQVDYEGSKANNILRIGCVNVEGAAILHEPEASDPDRKYKAFYWEHGSGGIKKREDGLVLWAGGKGDGMWVSFSPDGIHWTNYEGNPVIECGSDTGHHIVRDPNTGLYAAYGRFGFGRMLARSQIGRAHV